MAIYETRKGRIVGVIQPQSPTERPAPNRRLAPRRRSTVPGMIYPEADGKRTPIACTIADMSVTGARLLFKKNDPFSASSSSMDMCLLVIRHDRVMYQCEVIRREPNELGVKFMSAAKPLPDGARGN
jgi:PilZ domain